MSTPELTEAFLAKIAGWEAIKQARGLLERDAVLSSNWTPPILRGVVQEGGASYRAGLVIKDSIDLENMCSCRQSRQYGTICSHSVAVGLHHLRGTAPVVPPAGLATAPPGGARLPGAFRSATTPAAPVPKTREPHLRRAAPGQAGENVKLSVVFPPNLAVALSKGKVMLVLEAEWRGKRMPINALPKGLTVSLSNGDAALLDRVQELGGGELPPMLMVGSEVLADLLPTLVSNDALTLGRTVAVTVLAEPVRLNVRAELEKSGEIRLQLKSDAALPTLLAGRQHLWSFRANTFQAVGLPKGFAELLSGAPVRLARSRVPQFLSQEWSQLQVACQVEANFKLDDFSLQPQRPRILLNLFGGLAQLQGQLQCAYGTRIMTVGVTSREESLWLPDPENPTRYGTRDLGSEQQAVQRLQRAGFSGPDGQGRYQLVGQNQVLTFFARDFVRMEKEWQVTLEERLERSAAQNIERIEPQFQITPSGVQWFDFNVSYGTASGEKFSQADIQRLLLSGQTHTRLRNGKMAIIDTGAVEELQEVLVDCAPRQHAAGYRMNSAQAGYLDATLRQQQGWKVEAPASWRDRIQQQTGVAPMACPPLGDLDPILRPYQKQGVAWMLFLRQNQFGGILADEMGLGKTVQTLAFLRHCRAGQEQQEKKPCLIVCPTSLVFNWVNEAKKFTPQLRVVAMNGPQRHKLFAQLPEADLVITSYALLRRDAERYRDLDFDTVVLDEAQHIKNRQTQNAQAVKSVRSTHRLVLTGTPLENSVLDLWSIYDFLMPNYLGTAKEFRERYEQPIVRDKNPEVQARLARRLRPFLLRRLKREVAADLPPKLEQVSFCELTEEQNALYQQVLASTRQEVVQAVGQQGLAKSRMVILTALLRLRQICCDLRLLKLDNVDPDTASAKLELFSELLQEALDGGHRVLVFSQFVGMLGLLREKLQEEKVEFCYLDGSTTDRAAVVDRFQSNPAIPLFLISLKAGGVGLNLTGADTVIHFDPWWNPAVEDQATDRAHRIGQTRVVTSYKLITRGTVEEKILTLQQRKREMIRATLTGEESFTESLSWEEIQELLA